MDFKIDLRFLLLPLANLLFPLYSTAIIIVLLLFVSIKVHVTLQLTSTSLLRFQPLDFSVSVTICLLCLIFVSPPYFWIVNPILLLFLSRWDDLLLKMLKIVFGWLYHSIRSIRMHELLCIINDNHEQEEEAQGVDQQEELRLEVDVINFVAVDVNDQQEELN
ncbi:hypothetical protein L1987_67950 [Smallanthus sonchifolius]|uniref:Uncharacterized protein n=1 Tax=Smallanthus sonchifolius TaxID=185202 RepID=A0ACB9B3J7_9ASTR|nr:hypothetical protein L1987_67950 [Smallanthus sonchifolius]